MTFPSFAQTLVIPRDEIETVVWISRVIRERCDSKEDAYEYYYASASWSPPNITAVSIKTSGYITGRPSNLSTDDGRSARCVI